ncbi:hypothetical protein T492DRAFT_923090 [Pavlovales sp. CCMP2436]|nr:hypothetical protein T492DRAFT_923090 [Pavlovales sp. CCMP2436]|mmetsp:Transcript_18113/g.42102  ORF Transcript_18113/g.42102 Transcript_18113/m.42102 type:complete len:296 (-) Transcript_18113:250-1137(-)
MNSLLAKLESIEQETSEDNGKKGGKSGAAALDEFGRLKREVHREIKAVREAIQERDEMLHKEAGSKATVEMSARVRSSIKTIREEHKQMVKIQQTQANRRMGKNAQQIEHRAEVVELVLKHIEEVEMLEKRRYQAKDSETRTNLFAGSGFGGGGSDMNGLRHVAISFPEGMAGPSGGRAATDSDLPDIETQEGLSQLKQTDGRIDVELEEISNGVQDLRHIALDMKEEVRLQSAMVDEITNKVDGANDHLHNLNRKMKNALKEVRSADRFIIDFILIIVILGIATYCYNMFTGKV